MIKIELHLVLFIIASIVAIYKIWFEDRESWDFSQAFWVLGWIIFTLIYGGIFWW